MRVGGGDGGAEVDQAHLRAARECCGGARGAKRVCESEWMGVREGRGRGRE